jgi:DNA-binding response OmpR family regulator
MSDEQSAELNVLVVEDDPEVQQMLVKIIMREGHQAVPAGSSEEILSLLPYWTFQVAFLDQQLPGMEGLMLGEYLRNNNPEMTIALVTGMEDESLEKRSHQLRIQFISKPFKTEAISAVLDGHLQAVAEKQETKLSKEDAGYAPPIPEHSAILTECFSIPNVSNRVEERLVETLKRSMNNLCSDHRYTERDRVIALAGLISARVLGLTLPKSASGLSMYEEYDAQMRRRGRRCEFSN